MIRNDHDITQGPVAQASIRIGHNCALDTRARSRTDQRGDSKRPVSLIQMSSSGCDQNGAAFAHVDTKFIAVSIRNRGAHTGK